MTDINDAIRTAIVDVIQDAVVEVSGDGRHFNLVVKSAIFEGKNTLARHRLVLGAIKDLMAGDDAPVHAIDSLKATLPGGEI